MIEESKSRRRLRINNLASSLTYQSYEQIAQCILNKEDRLKEYEEKEANKMEDNFKPGDYFLEDGSKAYVEAKYNNTYYVRCYLGELEEPYEYYPSGVVICVDKIYEKPPVKLYDESITKLKKEIDSLKKERSELLSEMREEETKFIKVKDCLSNYSELNKLVDFINGEYKYGVAESFYNFKIESTKELLKVKEGHRITCKLIKIKATVDFEFSLVKSPDYCFSFSINDYSDGSGSDTKVQFFKTYEDALKVVEERIKSQFKGILEDKNKIWKLNELIESAKEYNIDIPEEILRLQKQSNNSEVDKELDRLNSEIKKVKAKYI